MVQMLLKNHSNFNKKLKQNYVCAVQCVRNHFSTFSTVFLLFFWKSLALLLFRISDECIHWIFFYFLFLALVMNCVCMHAAAVCVLHLSSLHLLYSSYFYLYVFDNNNDRFMMYSQSVEYIVSVYMWLSYV